MQGRDHGDVPDEVSFINTQLSGRYAFLGSGLRKIFSIDYDFAFDFVRILPDDNIQTSERVHIIWL
jgi:hypothetical protein